MFLWQIIHGLFLKPLNPFKRMSSGMFPMPSMMRSPFHSTSIHLGVVQIGTSHSAHPNSR
jgi:hypothetical protein